MRAALALLILISSSSAFAIRYGRDERILTCVSSAESTTIGANQAFDVQIVDLTEITITRNSDGAFLHAPASQGYYFLFGKGRSTGSLLDGSLSGYISSYRGGYNIGVQTSPGSYANGGNLENCTLKKVISEYDPMTATEIQFAQIADEASVGNGGSDFTRFDRRTLNMTSEKNELIEEGNEWEQCTWEMVEGLPQILELISEHTEDPDTANKLKAMINNPGFSHAVAYVSDSDISCSNTIVRLYSRDNIRLELFYSLGD